MQLACSVFCFGQVKMHLEDISPKESPVHVSGDTFFNDDASQRIRFSYRIEGSVANVSNRGLLLIVVHFTSSGLKGPGLDYSYQKDYFFSSDVLEPGRIEAFHSSSLRFGMPTVNGKPIPEDSNISSTPVVAAQVMFVQFVDGSTWGEVETGHEPLVVRNQTAQELARLERVLGEQGNQALKDEFSKSDTALPCIGAMADHCKGKAASCLADDLHSMIEAARQHQADLSAKSASLDDLIR